MTDVFDEVRSMPSQGAPADTDDPFHAVRSMSVPVAAAKPPEPTPSWLSAAKGVGEAGLALGSGALRGISSAANDILPEAIGGAGSRQAVAQEIAQDPVLNYRGGSEAQPILNALQTITKPVRAIGSAIHQGVSDLAGERTADVVGDIATLAPGARGAFSKLEPAIDIEEGHPLTAAAQAESGRISAFKARGEQLGLDLPEGGTEARHAAAATSNTPVANAIVRQDLQLPRGSPLSPPMLEAARNQYTAPAYQAVRDVQDIPLTPKYKKALGEIDNMDSIKLGYRPPTNGTMSGEQAVDLSRYLRNKANKYFSAAKGNPEYEDIGQAHWDAAQAVEDAVKDHLESSGQGQLAKNWDAARVYAAKTYSVQNALDGAGNVKVADLKQQLLKGKPLSGDLGTLANLGAQYPEAFRTTRLTTPAPGMVRRAAAAAAPVVAAGVGGWLGGAAGASVGTVAGQRVGERILNP